MVEVRYVRMHVHELLVTMRVLMPRQLPDRVIVVVMAVVVDMLVVVLDRHVAMLVLMGTVQHEADSDGGDDQGHNLPGRHRIGEDRPRHDRADERRGGEYQLGTGRAKIRAPATHNVIDIP